MSFPEACEIQALACDALGSPFTAKLLRCVAANLRPGSAIADRLLKWPGDLTPSGQSVPLRLAGSLHALVIDGSAPALAALYPPHEPTDAALWQAVRSAIEHHAPRLDTWLDQAPQTNEVARSAALIAAGHWLHARFKLPFVLSELGASAGLNLFWDHYALGLPDHTARGPADAVLTLDPEWRGPMPPQSAPVIAARRGVDLNPLSPAEPSDRLRLEAYVWADQSHRRQRLDAALTIARPMVDRASAADWLETRLAETTPGHLHLIFHTVAWQYFPSSEQRRAQKLIETAGDAAKTSTPLAWLRMEADDATPGAGLSVRLWPGDETIALGRVDFHGRWLDWSNGD
ncbi:MAG: DUF2332 family protein [Pseudomonadota bacterium]